MKELKKILRISTVGAATCIIMACSSSYPGELYVDNGDKNVNMEVYGNLVIAPTLNLKALFYTSAVTSKGSGAFDKEMDENLYNLKFSNANFYLLGYRKTYTLSGELGSVPNYQMLFDSAGNEDHKDCLVSASTASGLRGITSRADNRGVMTSYDDGAATQQHIFYWSKLYPNAGYQFFTYYLDDAQVDNILPAEDRTTYQLTIDGTQDVIYGSSQEVTAEYLDNYGLSSTEKSVRDNILYYGDGAYNTYGASHGLQPKINVEHALSRLVFWCSLKKKDTDLTITGIKIKAKTHGDLVVAAQDIANVKYTPTGNDDWMYLHSEPTIVNGQIVPGDVITAHKVQGDSFRLGSALVPEGVSQYEMVVSFSEKRKKDVYGNYEVVTQDLPLTLDLASGVFRRGYEYPVTLNVYGSADIQVYVGSPDWESGGSVIVPTGN